MAKAATALPPNNLGSAIRRRRQELGYSQQLLATELGVNQSTVAKWERGDTMKPHHLVLVARFLNMSTAEAMARFLGENEGEIQWRREISEKQAALEAELDRLRATLDGQATRVATGR